MKSFAELLSTRWMFHDLNVGFCGFEEKAFHLIIEDHSEVRKRPILVAYSDSGAHPANEVSNVLSLDVAADCAL